MAAGGDRRSSSGAGRSNGAGDHPQRRGFNRPGRTQVDRNRDLPVDRQLKILLKNPTPSPAEQNRLCELTRTKSYRAAVAVAKRMLAPGPAVVEPTEPTTPVRRRNPGNRPQG
ncbi:hypothetical protein SAMN04515671_2096 [Nakamurella panacisegetis]|uniref:Uncharacterized protein n=1 Tax=Nakamurella panacisegetis TaxID=1090615 RepID=A0A1H0MTB2_9ACTN|nr:hypothetical protein [Nakamurella panacisegetis]SDO83663.1 hypothetical protein SAMN04515671_2096 [Nakamurella panacisegetis]